MHDNAFTIEPKSHTNDTETKNTKADKNKTASGKTDTNTTKTKSKDDKETGSKKSKTHKSKTKKETTNEAETEITNELVYVVRMSAPSAISHSKQTSTAADYFSQFKCDPPCEHGGLCFRDTCLCKGRYYGPTCEKCKRSKLILLLIDIVLDAPPLVKINMIMFWSICVGLFLFGLLFSLIAAKAIVSLHARATNSVPNLQKRDVRSNFVGHNVTNYDF